MRVLVALATLSVLTIACSSDERPPSEAEHKELDGRVTTLEASFDTMQTSLSATDSSLAETQALLSSTQMDLDDLAAKVLGLDISIDDLKDRLDDVRDRIDHLDSIDYLDLGAHLENRNIRRTTHLPLRPSYTVALSKPELRSIATLRAAAEGAVAVGRQPEAAALLNESIIALGTADMSSAPIRGYFISVVVFNVLETIARQPEAEAAIVQMGWMPVPDGTAFGSSVIEDVGRAYALVGMFESIARQPEAEPLLLAAFPFGPITNLRDDHVQFARTHAIGMLFEALGRQPQADFSDAVALLGEQPLDLDDDLRWSHGYAAAAAVSAIARSPSIADDVHGYLETLLHIHVDDTGS